MKAVCCRKSALISFVMCTRVPGRSKQEPMNSEEIGCVYSVHNMELGTLNASIMCNTGVTFAFKLQIFRFIIKRKHSRILKEGNKKIKVQTFLFSLLEKNAYTHMYAVRCLHLSLWLEIDLNIVHKCWVQPLRCTFNVLVYEESKKLHEKPKKEKPD